MATGSESALGTVRAAPTGTQKVSTSRLIRPGSACPSKAQLLWPLLRRYCGNDPRGGIEQRPLTTCS